MRNLKPEEIQCRAQIVKEKGFSLLLYKDARCDMNILDEEIGPKNWQDEYFEIKGNLFCSISIWDEEKQQWISKQDAGSESNTEAKKGHASDAFKRAGFRWGIGRELYTAPFIWIKAQGKEVYKRNDGKYALNPRAEFSVKDIKTENGVIQGLTIIDKNLKVRFKMGSANNGQQPQKNGQQKPKKDDKPWLNEADKDKFIKAENWVKEGNSPNKLRNKYKVSKANMKHFERLYVDAGH